MVLYSDVNAVLSFLLCLYPLVPLNPLVAPQFMGASLAVSRVVSVSRPVCSLICLALWVDVLCERACMILSEKCSQLGKHRRGCYVRHEAVRRAGKHEVGGLNPATGERLSGFDYLKHMDKTEHPVTIKIILF